MTTTAAMHDISGTDTINHTRTRRLLFTLGCLLLSIFIHCWGLRKEDTDQLMALMTKQLQVLRPEDRDSFIDLCVSKGEECTEHQMSGAGALFSYRVGLDDRSKIRFWETYKCVYKRKLPECPVDGGWTEWAQWTICRADCEDRGWQMRTRYCENPKPSSGGNICDGIATTNRSCVGPCKGNANGQDEAKEYITQTHSVFPELESLCIEKHCYYEDVQKTIKDKSKVDKYWSGIICVKYNGPCPVNGGWGAWESWSQCSVQCGNGETFRKRDCNNPTTKNGGIFCIGPWYDSKRCLTKNCSGYDEYTDWSESSSCSESCGIYGVKTSVKSCLNEALCYIEGTLVKEIVKSIPCYGGECPRTGGWSSWGSWSACSARCGTGRKVRMRRCNEPPPSSGGGCSGPSISVESCDGSYCVQFPEASNYRKRRRVVLTPSVYLNSKAGYIQGRPQMQIFSSTHELSEHNQKDKIILDKPQHNKSAQSFSTVAVSDIDLEAASIFMPAMVKHYSVSENANSTWELKRQRIIQHAAVIRKRVGLPKIDEDDPFSMPLNPDLEPLYTEWSEWTQCTHTCGGGIRQRRRGCKNKKSVCKGETMPVQFCNDDPCPVLGGWGSWMSWSPCSVTCDSGESERYRPCNNPLPLFGGSCSGVNAESRPCTLSKCRRRPSYMWGPWELWSACTATCGGGSRTRRRYFSMNPVSEIVICNAIPCSENGLWAAWGGWSSCSLPCGLGITYRDRTCTDPAPVYGGEPCEGQGSEVQTCFGGPCIDEDDYGVLFRGAGYLQYAERGTATGFLMVFLRLKLIQERGTLFHHTNNCDGSGIDDCDLSIMLAMAGRSVHLAITTPTMNEPVKIMSTTAVELDKWLDIFVIVTGSWAGVRLNDEAQIVRKFNTRLKHGLNFDGILFVGANRFKQDGFHGIIAVLRKNFKVLVLFNMKSWSGYGAPADSYNVDKIQLPLAARHPNFKGRYYSHLFYRKSTYLQVLIIFYLTGFNGLLFFNGGMETNSSAAVTVKDGALEFCLNCGEKPLCRKAYELKVLMVVFLSQTDQWYLLKVSATGNEGQIRMNAGDAMQIMCPVGDRYVPRSSIYVGGAGQLDWPVIEELTKSNVLFQGMIDTFVVNDKSVTYKMASLIDGDGWVNSLGYSLADHVTEVYENERALTTLRCGVPEKTTHSQLVRLIWLQDMKRIVASPGTEISDSDSVNQTVSSISLHSSHHYEGVYACLLSSDGVIVNLHAFVLIRYITTDDSDSESLAEWIMFIVLLILILLVCCPLLIYFCTKNSSFWEKFKKKDTAEEEPLIQESDTTDTEGAESSGTSVTSTPEMSPLPVPTEGEEPAPEGIITVKTTNETPVAAVAAAAAPAEVPAAAAPAEVPPAPAEVSRGMFGEPLAGVDLLQMPSVAEPTICASRKLNFAEQIAIKMPPYTFHPCPDPSIEAVDNYLFTDTPSDYPCTSYYPCPPSASRQEWDPCTTVRMGQPCQPCPPISQPCFIPGDVYNLHAGPDAIRNIDFLRNPYYLSGTFNPCNFNQNNPSTDNRTNNAALGYSHSSTDSQSCLPTAGVSEGGSKANKKCYGPHSESDRNTCQENSCSEENEHHRKHFNETNIRYRTDPLMCFDEKFTTHNELESFQRNVCDLEMSDLSVPQRSSFKNRRRVKHKDSEQSARIGEDSFTSVDNVCNKLSGVADTDISHPMHRKHLKHLQNLQKYGHKSHEPKADLQKQSLSSVSKGKLQNSTSANMDEQCCQTVGNWSDKNKDALDSEYTCENNNNVTILTSEPTSKIVRSMKGQHKRTKSLSRLPDTSLHTSDVRTVVVQEHLVSLATSSQMYTQTAGVGGQQYETNDTTQFTFSEGSSHLHSPGNS